MKNCLTTQSGKSCQVGMWSNWKYVTILAAQGDKTTRRTREGSTIKPPTLCHMNTTTFATLQQLVEWSCSEGVTLDMYIMFIVQLNECKSTQCLSKNTEIPQVASYKQTEQVNRQNQKNNKDGIINNNNKLPQFKCRDRAQLGYS